MKIYGQLVDIHNRDIYPAVIIFRNGKIERISKSASAPDVYIMPGLIDSHIHIESTMVTPGAFSIAAVRQGTIGVVSDPHEIANVLGVRGVKFMITDGHKVPMRFWFGAPSCVPATSFETSGATVNHKEIRKLMELPEIKYLAEMMNFPGVINDDSEVHKKLDVARKINKPVDGHAPGLSGEMLRKYVDAGISTDHESGTLKEANEKISLGMKILIREGSAARNLNALKELFNTSPEMIMLCSDDLHPEMLQERHINKLIAYLISDGFNAFDVIRSATINPVRHYNLEAGMMRPGDNADFILVDDLGKMNVLETWIDGKQVFCNGNIMFSYNPGKGINNFRCQPLEKKDIRVINQPGKIRIIEAYDQNLITKELIGSSGKNKLIEADKDND